MDKQELLERLDGANEDAEVLVNVDGVRVEDMKLSRSAMLEVKDASICPQGCHINLQLGRVMSD